LIRFGFVALLTAVAVALLPLAILGPWGWWIPAAVVAALAAVGIYDLVQRKHSVLRNYPILGHMRFLLEALRPEIQQYFIEPNFDGRRGVLAAAPKVSERSGDKAFRVICRSSSS